MFKSAVAITLASATLMVTPAVSATESESQQVRLTYSDLDLSTEQGREELDSRIRKAAREVCGQDDINTGSRIPSSESAQCYRSARAQLDRRFAQIIADHQQRGG